MDEHPDLEFDYFLTERLGWRSVAAMRRGLSAVEYRHWCIFFGRKNQRSELRAQAGG